MTNIKQLSATIILMCLLLSGCIDSENNKVYAKCVDGVYYKLHRGDIWVSTDSKCFVGETHNEHT